MKKAYAEFCSRHLKAVKLYKELLARDKRLQYFIRVRCFLMMKQLRNEQMSVLNVSAQKGNT